MRLPGQMENSVILCGRCGKRISVKGISILEKEEGEYRVTFFPCPHCGAAYQITTTDEGQRDLIWQRKAAEKKLEEAVRGKFREKTIREREKELQGIKKQLDERVAELREVGEKLLRGEAATDGQESGEGGAESVSDH